MTYGKYGKNQLSSVNLSRIPRSEASFQEIFREFRAFGPHWNPELPVHRCLEESTPGEPGCRFPAPTPRCFLLPDFGLRTGFPRHTSQVTRHFLLPFLVTRHKSHVTFSCLSSSHVTSHMSLYSRIDVGYDAQLHCFAFCSPIVSCVTRWGVRTELHLGAGGEEG